jgi:tellurite resistance protein TerC
MPLTSAITQSPVMSWNEYWWLYLLFNVFVIGFVIFDLGVLHKESKEMSTKEAGFWSLVWVAMAGVVGAGIYYYTSQKFGAETGKNLFLEYITGYVVEKSLAIDNIFVFIVIFSYFQIPLKYQQRILSLGIIGALLFRAAFIAAGSYLMQIHWVIILFGVFLIMTGLKMALQSEKPKDLNDTFIVKLVKKFLPINEKYEGPLFYVDKAFTKLFLALIVIEFTDVIFALDSVPAIFALTNEPFIVFTSNIMAILGLRALYFLLIGVISKFHLLKYGLAATLVFVGLKMTILNKMFDGHFPVTWSLMIICSCIGLSVAASWLFPKKAESQQ